MNHGKSYCNLVNVKMNLKKMVQSRQTTLTVLSLDLKLSKSNHKLRKEVTPIAIYKETFSKYMIIK